MARSEQEEAPTEEIRRLVAGERALRVLGRIPLVAITATWLYNRSLRKVEVPYRSAEKYLDIAKSPDANVRTKHNAQKIGKRNLHIAEGHIKTRQRLFRILECLGAKDPDGRLGKVRRGIGALSARLSQEQTGY